MMDPIPPQGKKRKRSFDMDKSGCCWNPDSDTSQFIKRFRGNRFETRFYPIVIRSLTGKNVVINVHPDDTIFDVKCFILSKEGIPPEDQRLIYQGKTLADCKHIKDYNIKDSSVLYIVLSIQGG